MRLPLLPGTGAGDGGAPPAEAAARLAGGEGWTHSRGARSCTGCSSCTTSPAGPRRANRRSGSPPVSWAAPGPAELEAIARLVSAALREQPARRIAAAAEVWREQPFAYPAGDHCR